jgi:hypothetical protein
MGRYIYEYYIDAMKLREKMIDQGIVKYEKQRAEEIEQKKLAWYDFTERNSFITNKKIVEFKGIKFIGTLTREE